MILPRFQDATDGGGGGPGIDGMPPPPPPGDIMDREDIAIPEFEGNGSGENGSQKPSLSASANTSDPQNNNRQDGLPEFEIAGFNGYLVVVVLSLILWFSWR